VRVSHSIDEDAPSIGGEARSDKEGSPSAEERIFVFRDDEHQSKKDYLINN